MECDVCRQEIEATIDNPDGVFVRLNFGTFMRPKYRNICMECIADASTTIDDYMDSIDDVLGKYSHYEAV